MKRPFLPVRALVPVLLLAVTSVVATCTSDSTTPPPGAFLAIGTWGGDTAGVIVSDSGTHVHIGCTYGDVLGLVPLDANGTLDAPGSYLLRAYPVAVGPSMPAQFSGHVTGKTLTLVVAVNDTVEHKLRILGPVTVQLGRQPQMGPCPICRQPATRLR